MIMITPLGMLRSADCAGVYPKLWRTVAEKAAIIAVQVEICDDA